MNRGAIDDPVREWVPLVQQLLARGVSIPLTVLAFTHYRIGPVAWGNAVATVAAATGRSQEDVGAEVVGSCANPALAPGLCRELAGLHAMLDQVPGLLRGAGMIPSPEALVGDWRGYARYRDMPFPCSLASQEWTALLRSAKDAGFGLLELHQSARRFRVRLTGRDQWLEPLGANATEETIAEALSIPVTTLRKTVTDRLRALEAGTAQERVRAVSDRLRTLTGVTEVQDAPPGRGYGPPTFVPPPGVVSLAPPWLAFPEPIQSMRWRMGAGEDYIDQWYAFWRGLSPGQRAAYFVEHPVPAEWREWVDRLGSDESGQPP